MKILYVCHKPPVPNLDGGTFAMKQFIEALIETVPCDAFILSTHKHPFTTESKVFFDSKFEKHQQAYIHTETKLIPFLISLFVGRSYILQRFQSLALKQYLAKTNYDLIVCDSLFSLYAVQKAKPVNSPRLWLRSHNVEFVNWITLAKQQPFFKKWLYNIQAKQLKREELDLVKSAHLNLCISALDQEMFKELIPNKISKLLPIHIEVNANLELKNRACYFLGSQNWGPNVDSVKYLLECWQDDAFQKHELTIAGGFNKMFSTASIPPSVLLLGRVENMEEFVSSQGILVAPSFSGSGIKVKILEALGMGIPVITTVIGAQGISDEAGLILVDNKLELLNAIERLKSDDVYFQKISYAGKSYIQKKHSFTLVKGIIQESLGE